MKPERRVQAAREDILRRRAERLAAAREGEADRRIAAQVALVGVGAHRYGIPVDSLREIVPLPDVTSLPGLPPWLLGIANVRGELLGVVDLATVLGATVERASAMAIVAGAGGPLGLAVQSVIGFREVYEDELSAELGADPHRPFRAMTRDFVALLDVTRLPAAPGEAR
ncbi:chemotaxis protein CheW [Sorangium sp. So ce1389]|uniref:chemotaxis protein CheW n=1 Tax=Sorangium sp. So ce1389 TaxID=3133336 RepID=UPI003F6144A8